MSHSDQVSFGWESEPPLSITSLSTKESFSYANLQLNSFWSKWYFSQMVTLFTTSKPHYKPNRLPQNFMLSLMKWQVFRFWGFCGNIFEATFFQIIAKLKEQPLNSCGISRLTFSSASKKRRIYEKFLTTFEIGAFGCAETHITSVWIYSSSYDCNGILVKISSKKCWRRFHSSSSVWHWKRLNRFVSK